MFSRNWVCLLKYLFFRSFLAGSVWLRGSKLETETSIVFVVWKKIQKQNKRNYAKTLRHKSRSWWGWKYFILSRSSILKKFINRRFSPILLYPSSTKVSAIPTYILHAFHVYFTLDIFPTYMLLDRNCTFIREIRVCDLGNDHFDLFNCQILTFGHQS